MHPRRPAPEWSQSSPRGDPTRRDGAPEMSEMFESSAKGKEFEARLKEFMSDHVYPAERRFYQEHRTGTDRWQPIPVIEELKKTAKAAGLWNLFLPESERGAGLTNLEYAPLCEIMGRVPFA